MKKFAALLILFLLFTSCGQKEEDLNAEIVDDKDSYQPSEGRYQGEVEKVNFVLDWTPNTNHTGIFVAKEKGFYTEEGIDLQIIQPPENGAEVLVASGNADVGVSFQDVMTNALSGDNKLPIKAVAAILQHNTSGIVSLKGKGMDRPKGLEGHSYATWDWDIEKAILEDVVTKDGGDFSKVKLIPSTVTDEVTALRTNMVDSIWIYYSWVGAACEIAKLPIDYFAFIDINPVFDYYTPVIISSEKFMNGNSEILRAFLRATKKGYEFAAENPDEAAKLLLREVPTLSEELVMRSQKLISKEYISDAPSWGVIDSKRWNAFYNWLFENNLINEKIAEDAGFTNEFLK